MPRNFTQKAMSLVVHQDTGTDTSDATAVASDIRQGKTAYGAQGKLTGTLVPLDTSDANAVATDIKTGKTAYVNGAKVTGTFAGVDSSDANATAADVSTGKTAYVGNTKITGTHTCPPVLDTSDANAIATDIASGKTAYVNGVKITGALSNLTSAGTISYSANTTDKLSYSEGSVNSKLMVKATVSNDAIAHDGDVIQVNVWDTAIASVLDLTADKLVSGYSIFGVDGTATTGTDTSDANATASDIAEGKTAYVNGSKITGTGMVYPYAMQCIPASFAQAVTVDQTTVVTPASAIDAGDYLISAGDVITTNWNTVYGIATYNSDDMTYSITWCNPAGAGDPATFDVGANSFVISSNTLPIHPN